MRGRPSLEREHVRFTARVGGALSADCFDERRRWSFSLDEYVRRIEALRRRMAEAGVDVVLIDQLEHLAYYTGYVPTAAMYQACLLPLDGEPVAYRAPNLCRRCT